MTWGIATEYDDRGLTCCGWLRAGPTTGIYEFDTEAEAKTFIRSMQSSDVDRIVTPREIVE